MMRKSNVQLLQGKIKMQPVLRTKISTRQVPGTCLPGPP